MAHIPSHFQTEEQRAAAFRDSTISSENIQETPDIALEDAPQGNFSSAVDIPEPTPPPPPEATVPDTPFASDVDSLVRDITSDTSLAGDISAFRTEQREEVGLTGLQKTEEDLFRKAQNLKLKSEDLGLQFGEEAQRIQQESAGRGRTAGGVRPLTASAQRKVNLERAGVRSELLETVATLNAVQGRITTARGQIQDAVEAE